MHKTYNDICITTCSVPPPPAFYFFLCLMKEHCWCRKFFSFFLSVSLFSFFFFFPVLALHYNKNIRTKQLSLPVVRYHQSAHRLLTTFQKVWFQESQPPEFVQDRHPNSLLPSGKEERKKNNGMPKPAVRSIPKVAINPTIVVTRFFFTFPSE